jgi:hypothetical protein
MRETLETFEFAKMWYVARMIPLPFGLARQVATIFRAFMRRGHLESLAWKELQIKHMPFDGGGMKLSCLQTAWWQGSPGKSGLLGQWPKVFNINFLILNALLLYIVFQPISIHFRLFILIFSIFHYQLYHRKFNKEISPCKA